jgi:hypothetical protein
LRFLGFRTGFSGRAGCLSEPSGSRFVVVLEILVNDKKYDVREAAKEALYTKIKKN